MHSKLYNICYSLYLRNIKFNSESDEVPKLIFLLEKHFYITKNYFRSDNDYSEQFLKWIDSLTCIQLLNILSWIERYANHINISINLSNHEIMELTNFDEN